MRDEDMIYAIEPWRARLMVWLRLDPFNPLRQDAATGHGRPVTRDKAAARCDHCNGALCVHNGTLVCSMCGRPA